LLEYPDQFQLSNYSGKYHPSLCEELNSALLGIVLVFPYQRLVDLPGQGALLQESLIGTLLQL
jgi:hypothetical protein